MSVKKCIKCSKLLYEHNKSGFCYYCLTKKLTERGKKHNGKHNKC